MKLAIKSNADQMVKHFAAIKHKQLPFVTAVTLTQTVTKIVREERKEMRRVFSNPSRYVTGGVVAQTARKEDKPIRAAVTDAYFGAGVPAANILMPHIKGTHRKYKSHERRLARQGLLPAPMMTAPNREYSWPNRARATAGLYNRILTGLKSHNPDQQRQGGSNRRKNKATQGWYIAKKAGRNVGVSYRPKGGQRQKVLNFIAPPTYKKRFDYYGVIDRVVEKDLDKIFARNLRRAIATAKGVRRVPR